MDLGSIDHIDEIIRQICISAYLLHELFYFARRLNHRTFYLMVFLNTYSYVEEGLSDAESETWAARYPDPVGRFSYCPRAWK